MTGREFGYADPILRAVVASACVWEVAALTTHRLPTISRLSKRHPLFRVAVLATLAHHFRPDPACTSCAAPE
jgi:hypothetical protein